MKLQNLIVIFIIIVLPIILIMSLYISNGLKTVEYQALYDNGLVNASHDALHAFELNTANDPLSDNPETKRDILKASIKMYEKSLCNTCNIPSYNTDEIEEYIPAIVFGMHDGFYMYAPSYNSVTGEYEHSLKNYVYYSETVTNDEGKEFTITYSLDNYITISGDFGTGYEIKKGYLRPITTTGEIADRERIGEEYLGLTIPGENIDGTVNIEAREYYSNSYKFSYQFIEESGLKDIVIDGLKPFDIKPENDPEDENSDFSKHKRKIIREKIEGVLNSTITAYSERIWGRNYKMPKLAEEEWEKIYSNISMISFFQGKDIGFTKYNGYTVVNSTNSKEYVNPSLMYFVSGEKYHDIRCNICESVVATPGENLNGYRIGSFESRKIEDTDESGNTITKYEYDHTELACYECINNAASSNISVYDYVKIDGGTASSELKSAYWASLGRERNNATEVTQGDIEIQVTFDLNGGSGINVNAYNAIYEHGDKIKFPDHEYSITELKSMLTRTGHEFIGWSTTKNGTPLADVDNVKAYTDITFYAVWDPEPVEITINWNYSGANPSEEIVSIDYGERIFSNIPTPPRRIEYTLVGWSTSNNIADKLTNEQVTNAIATREVTYYAIWEIRQYDVTFHLNDGTGRSELRNVPHGTLINEIIEDPERLNYRFKGWGTNPTGEEIIDEGLTATSRGGQYYAIWIPIYKITFDYDGGRDNDGRFDKIKEYAKDVEIIFPNIKKDGNTLQGWQKNGTGDVVNTATATETTTYKAKWAVNKYTVEFYYNYGGMGMIHKLENVEHGSNIDFPEDPNVTGLTFIGWSKDPDANSGIRNAQAIGNVMGEVIKYYAIWEINTYDITFNYNGGQDNSGRDSSTVVDKEYGTKITFPEITREGHTLAGWKKDGYNGYVDTANETVIDNDVTYYASWIPNIYTITYIRNHDSNDDTPLNLTPQTVRHFQTVELSTPPNRTGYNFLGWSTTRNGEAKSIIKVTNDIIKSNTITLYAIWEIKTYDITFDFNDGTGDKVVIEGVEHFTRINSIKPDDPTRPKYAFMGWSESADNDTSKVVTFNSETPIVEDYIIYYAVWIRNLYTITFDYNGGSGVGGDSITIDNVLSGTVINDILLQNNITNPTKTGYSFNGWSKNHNATSGQMQLTGKLEDDEIYYATWIDNIKPIIHSVTFEPPKEDGWTNRDVVVTVNATDLGSGIKEYSFDGGTTWQLSNIKTYTSNTTNIRIVVKDNAGNISNTYNGNIDYIDKTPPTLQATYNNGYIRITTSDTQSGVNLSSFKIGNTSYTLSSNNCNIEGKYFANGNNTLTVKDNAGNVKTITFTLNKEAQLSVDDLKIKFKVTEMYTTGGQGFHESHYKLHFKIEDCEVSRLYNGYGCGYEVRNLYMLVVGEGTEYGYFDSSESEITMSVTSNADIGGRTQRLVMSMLFYDETGNAINKFINIEDSAVLLNVKLQNWKYVADDLTILGQNGIDVNDHNYYEIPSAYMKVMDR